MLDGDQGFGQVVARRGMELAIEKARLMGLSAVTLQRANHVGRLGDYVEMAAKAGMIGLMWVNAPLALGVAPWGGAARRLATNPHAVSVPGPSGAAMVLDFATSVVAEGKVRVKRNRKEPLPAGWAVDPEGRPVTDSTAFYGPPRAGLLPMAGHKGTALALVVEVMGGILSGAGVIGGPPAPGINGCLVLLVEIERFLPLAEFTRQVQELAGFVTSSKPAAGSSGVMVPGEPEARMERERGAHGIPVEDETWRQIEVIAAELGVG
jgi:uncharacterized oxidoreductase